MAAVLPSSVQKEGPTALFSLDSMLKQAGVKVPRIRVADIGALSLGEGCQDCYTPLLRQGLCDVVGFEPVPGECERLNSVAKSKAPPGCSLEFFPHFIGDGTDGEFRLCSAPMTSSLYEPNTELLERYQGIEELTRVTERENVKTTRLDSLSDKLGTIDMLKMDVQGGELDVIKGGGQTLNQVCVIETEVEFVPLYKDQPLFADVDVALRGLGFDFHRFNNLMGRCMRPLYLKENPYQTLSQTLWGDAIYIRGLHDTAKLSQEQIIKTCLIIHEIYHSYDVVAYLLGVYDKVEAESKDKGQVQGEADEGKEGEGLQAMYMKELKVS